MCAYLTLVKKKLPRSHLLPGRSRMEWCCHFTFWGVQSKAGVLRALTGAGRGPCGLNGEPRPISEEQRPGSPGVTAGQVLLQVFLIFGWMSISWPALPGGSCDRGIRIACRNPLTWVCDSCNLFPTASWNEASRDALCGTPYHTRTWPTNKIMAMESATRVQDGPSIFLTMCLISSCVKLEP